MKSTISSDLHTFFMPQVEQLAMEETLIPFGASFDMTPDVGTGSVWVAEVQPGCMLTVLDISTKHTFPLRSRCNDFACIGRMSQANTQASPLPASTSIKEENLVTFGQRGGR